jgi:predicted nucleic acid-binding protein
MLDSGQFKAVLDACVLYPAPLRDLILNLADQGLFAPKWSKRIHAEWTSNLLLNRSDLSADQLDRTVKLMNTSFPDAMVVGFEQIISELNLPDPDDRHVLAAAVESKTAIIVTSNLRDFPKQILKKYSIEAQHPDTFVRSIISLNEESAIMALENQVSRLKNPPQSIGQVLLTLENNGLRESVACFRALLGS